MKSAADILVLKKKLSAAAKKRADEAIASGVPVEEALRSQKVDGEEIAQALAEGAGLPYVDLRETDIDRATLGFIPRAVAESAFAVAYEAKGNDLSVALVDPTNFQTIQTIEFQAQSIGKTARFATASRESYLAAIAQYEALESEVARALEAAKGRFGEEEKAAEKAASGAAVAGPIKGEALEEVIKGAPVSRMVSVIMRYAVEQGASDIHIEPVGKESRIRYRIDGVLRTALKLPIYVHSSLISRIKVLASLKLDETRVPQDGRITQNFDGKVIDFRVSSLPVVDNEKIVMRILDTSVGVPTLVQLGFRPEHVDIITREIRQPHGLLLISGPTGSGKSTTLYTCLNMMNSEGLNLVTLEDPVEYYIKGVNQSQTRAEIGYTFASGLRSLLRQDPNVIMVGEIRDKETAELAVHAALTGHLIFSTIHTNDAFGVTPRLVDLGVEPFLLAATLNAAVAQRLARKICQACKTEQDIPERELAMMRAELKKIPKRFLPEGLDPDGHIPAFVGAGCEECKGQAYAGRVCVAEILMMTPQLQRIVSAGFKPQEVEEEAMRQEMITLRQDAILKVVVGLTTVEEVLRISAENPNA